MNKIVDHLTTQALYRLVFLYLFEAENPKFIFLCLYILVCIVLRKRFPFHVCYHYWKHFHNHIISIILLRKLNIFYQVFIVPLFQNKLLGLCLLRDLAILISKSFFFFWKIMSSISWLTKFWVHFSLFDIYVYTVHLFFYC